MYGAWEIFRVEHGEYLQTQGYAVGWWYSTSSGHEEGPFATYQVASEAMDDDRGRRRKAR